MAEKHWIQKALAKDKPGSLHRDLHVPAGRKIPLDQLLAAAKQRGIVGQRARLAETLRKFH